MEHERREYETHWKMNEATREVFDRIAAAAAAGLPPADAGGRTVLDIGCGGQSNIVFPDATRVIGIDVDEAGLRRNTTITEQRLISINEFEPGGEAADAIACIFTLEHVEEPDVVFGKLARSLKPGGVMVIAVPQVRSPKALVTRYTPQAVHEWFYRRVLGRDPETNGTPFETVLDPAIAPDRLRRLSKAFGMTVLAEEEFEDNKQRQFREKMRVTGWRWSAARALSRLLARHDAAATDYLVALKAPVS